MIYDYDVLILGGGSAGSSAAAAASEAGVRTAMINEGELGGLCILRGCMPTKAMLASAHAVHEANHMEHLGVSLEGRVVPDFARIMQRRGELVQRFQRAKIESIVAGGYEVIPGRARFAADRSVDVDGRRLSARAYVIATGSETTLPRIRGIDDVPTLTSDDVMRLTKQPAALVVQGSGAIGLELAQFFARIGTEVLLVGRSPMLHRQDPEAGVELTRALQDEPNLRLAVPGSIESLTPDGDGLVAQVRDAGTAIEFRADAVLVATGRRAALDSLELHHVNLDHSGGYLEHDAGMRTSQENLFVAGDATGRYQILHLSNQEGRVAGFNAAGGKPRKQMDYRLRMNTIFTDPPFSQVGMSEEDAGKQGIDVIVGRSRFPETGRAITMGVRHGLWKLLADRHSGEILGSSILGPRADDLIHLVSTMMHFRGTVEEIASLPWYHPTLSEVMIDLGRDLRRQRG